jgi:predicted amidohydrolase YtcJ
MPAKFAKTLLRGAVIRSTGLDHSAHDSILIGGNRILWIGAGADAPAADRTIDLHGSCVIPGLTDAHAHLYTRALELLNVQLGDAPSIDQLLARVGQACRAASGDEWIVSSDYNELVLAERCHPLREQLDAVSEGRPVLLRRTGGHLAVANSAALHAAGLDDGSADPPGGTLERHNGKLTGVLAESAADLVAAFVPAPSRDRTLSAISGIGRECLGLGLVSVVEAAVGFSSGFSTEWNVWTALKAAGDFPLRMGFMLRIDPAEAKRLGITPSQIDDRWQVRTLKFFVDGIIGARTAALSAPYADGAGCGLLMEDPAELRAKVIMGHAEGWQLAAHVIGDRAISHWLGCLIEAQTKVPRADPRHRLEHFALPDDAAMARVAALGAVVVPQYGFIRRLGASFAAAIGPERTPQLYPGRSLLCAGIPFAGSSDLPIGPLSPFVGIAAAVDRTAASGLVIAADEALTVEQAVAAYAQGGPYAMEQELRRGRLAAGQLADVAVLDRDITTCSQHELAGTRSRLTIVGGEVVFSDGTLTAPI